MNNNKGITLIALVITIIVLLILAGVTIAMLTGQNGLLSRASGAKVDSLDAEVKERINMELNAQMANAMAGVSFDTAATITSNIGTLPTGYSVTVTQAATSYSTSASVSIAITKPSTSKITSTTASVAYSSGKWTITPVQ